ncbi:MAG: NUDIX domain-containing protein [Caldisericia bacterium]|nr:NUDIX domain-containing protein [Caldisericia bacterium]
MKEERTKLPFRKNCEGYFLNEKGNKILAKETESELIIFPGGGIDENETIKEGMIRETFEETGARVEKLEFLGKIRIIWEEDWAKTKKQKKRYLEFQGDDMHFFRGTIKEIKTNELEEDSWNENKFMDLKEVIQKIESKISFEKSTKEYRKAQLNFLKEILNKK